MSDPMPSSFDDKPETGWQKVGRKLREEPLIPLGTFLTCLALYNAFRAMRKGDQQQVQRMFRARVGAQAFTVLAMVAGGAYYGADREKRKELIKLEAQGRAEERHQKWLRELEIRDEEEKALQAHLKKRRERLEAKAKTKEEGASSSRKKEGEVDGGDGEKHASSSGGGVMGALASAGGWFGTGKKDEFKKQPKEESKPTEQEKLEVDKPKK